MLWLLGFSSALLCIAGLVVALILFSAHPSQYTAYGPTKAPIFWQLDENQTVARNGTDVFALKNISSSPQAFHFFYAFSSPHQEDASQLEVISRPSSQPQIATQLTASVQPLGRLGNFVVGVIHVPYRDQAGQTITIQGISPENTPTWHITPLKQMYPEPAMGMTFFINQKNLPAITWYGPVGEHVGVAFFQDTASGSRVFLRLDNPMKAISQAEYLQFSGQG